MTPDVFDHLKQHYISIADELRSQARQAGLLTNPTGVGTEREEVYRTFLERHLPKMCDVFLGGYVFDMKGNSSTQVDIIATNGSTPRFIMPRGNRYIAPLEGTVAVAEIKSRLDKNTLIDALNNCASVPTMPDQRGIVPPFLKISEDSWQDTPYKIVFAYDGIDANTVCDHITDFYNEHPEVPLARQPNIVHVLQQYLIIRTVSGVTVLNPDGQPDANQPDVGQYYAFFVGPDVSALAWTLNAITEKAWLSNNLLFKYGEWHNKIVERIQREFAE